MKALRSFVKRSLLPRSRKIVLRSWQMPLWSFVFDQTLGRRHPDVTRSVRLWLPTIRSFVQGSDGPVDLNLSGTGMLIVMGPAHCLYLPLGKLSEAALVLSHENHRRPRLGDAMRELFDYAFTIHDAQGASYGKVERLGSVSLGDQGAATKAVLTALQFDGRRGSVVGLPVVSALEKMSGDRPYLAARAAAFLSQDWQTCRAHADLTPANIMQSEGRPRLIDLDRFQDSFPAFFDPTHYAVETMAKGLGVSWLDVLSDPRHLSQLHQAAFQDCAALEPSVDWQDILDFYVMLRVMLERRGDGIASPRWEFRVGRLLDQIELRLQQVNSQ